MHGFKGLMGLMAFTAAGCASHPANTQVDSHPQAGTVTAAVPAANAAPAPGDIQAQRLAKAKNLNLKIYNKDGQELFCRSNYKTGSHIQRDERCYTAEQLDRFDQAQQRQVEQFLVAPNRQNPGTLPP
jgi:hypothetical protein